MKLIYTLTLADYQAAQQLNWRQTLSRRVISFSVYWCLPALCGSIALWVGRRMGIFLTGLSAGYVLLYGFALGLLILGLKAKLGQPQRFKRQFERKFPSNQRSASIEIEDDGVSSAILGTDEAKFEWRTIVGFAQDDKMTLLYVAKSRFLFFPTTAMSPAQRAELSDLISHHVTKRHP